MHLPGRLRRLQTRRCGGGEYLDRLGHEKEIPIADADDPRWGKLENNGGEAGFDEDETDDEVLPAQTSVSIVTSREKLNEHVGIKLQHGRHPTDNL
jgi:hypothetical protein